MGGVGNGLRLRGAVGGTVQCGERGSSRFAMAEKAVGERLHNRWSCSWTQENAVGQGGGGPGLLSKGRGGGGVPARLPPVVISF